MKNLFILCTLIILFASCKKDPAIIQPQISSAGPTNATVNGSRRDLTHDSLFLYAKEVYYWNAALPAYDVFNPRSYINGSDASSYQLSLFNLSQYSINPATGKAYEFVASSSGGNTGYSKYSYIKSKSSANPVAYLPDLQGSVDIEGNGFDTGISFSAIGSASSYEVRVKFVSPGSPAHQAGFSRGDFISKINNSPVGTNYNNEVSLINNALSGSSVKLAGKRINGSAFEVTLERSSYKSSPVYKDTVIVSNGKKVGYIAYARFSNAGNSNSVLNSIFAEFSGTGVTDLVIDLRYNGGGYVHTAEHFTNLIAPSSLNGKVMFRERFNTLMQNGGATILKNQPVLDGNNKPQFTNGRPMTYADYSYKEEDNSYNFKKAGSLNSIQKVVFIISASTASASEMLINNLRPYIDVKLVGKPSYGKPVGFFPITLENNYNIYYSMFTSINSAGQTDYFSGFTPDWDAADDVTRNFGDPKEICFAAALNYIGKGSFVTGSSVATLLSIKGEKISTTSSSFDVRELNDDNFFKGMVENRFKIRK
ncbi:S41 family peptidase [Daejeonella sp.]|uniref:S41 family peptidase n=1 Tax=Daejeonella sp. TaxID=2805397 RepID=UPI003983D931